MKRTFTLIAAVSSLFASGCAVSAYATKTLTIPAKQEAPVVVTAQCRGTSTDWFLIHTAGAHLDLQSTLPTAQPVAHSE